MTNQLTSLNTDGGLQKKASEAGSSQSNTKCISPSAGSITVDTTTAITSVASLPVAISSPLQNNNHPDIACTNTVGKQEINISSATDAMEITKPVTSMPFAQSSIPGSTSTAVIPLTVTSPTSSVSCVQPSGLSGVQKSPPSNQKQGKTFIYHHFLLQMFVLIESLHCQPTCNEVEQGSPPPSCNPLQGCWLFGTGLYCGPAHMQLSLYELSADVHAHTSTCASSRPVRLYIA